MRFSTFVAALLPVGAVFAETWNVTVGGNNTLTFNPTSVNATNGDTIAFTFVSKNHTVTQSSFASPCTNLTTTAGETILDSGFQFIQPDATSFPVYSFNMANATTPLWFYCRQANHCQQGMVFAVNPTAAKSFAAFQAAAMNSSSTSAPASSGGAPSTTPSASGSGTAPPATTSNAAGVIKAGSAAGLLLTGAGLVAGLVL
ncbi:hypothetical protein EW026_g4305 [Hermanssonia centrifuga]|uniref:Uncharacterized protein n=1 Tax=Hermanssonia centrifuga TaxID=98765 RepID=A0A4S4KHV5_9APHY|nr:hypothetical protein EW026_g4305 [Hermanssonia centrifuga]